MRVLFASDRIGALSSRAAGSALAAGWPGAARAVLPVGEAGSGFVEATADRLGVSVESAGAVGGLVSTARTDEVAAVAVEGIAPPDGIPYDASSVSLGEAVLSLLGPRPPRRLLVDLAGLAVHDGGAGFLAALGATADGPLTAGVAGLGQLSRVGLDLVKERLAGTELVGVVPLDQLNPPLLGLRGITSLRRQVGTSPELMLRTDAALEQFSGLVDAGAARQPGAGACGGLGFAVLALGGRLTTGAALALASVSLSGVDLVVTGCTSFDFAARGGGVVAAVASAAGAALSPCIVVAEEVFVGAREMRTMGIDAAYAVGPAGDLAATARRVARSWSW